MGLKLLRVPHLECSRYRSWFCNPRIERGFERDQLRMLSAVATAPGSVCVLNRHLQRTPG